MSQTIEKFTSIVFTVAILVIAGTFVYRELPRNGTSDDEPPSAPPTFVPDWRRGVAASTLIGDSLAPVVLLEFADLQCPACRQYQPVIREIRSKFKQDLVLAFVHTPIPAHSFAVPAARAAECAKKVGKFAAFVDTLYGNQRALTHRSMWSYAAAAGVVDSASFARCISDAVPLDVAIQAGRAAGTALGVDATPTIVVNGWRYDYPPNAKVLSSFIQMQLDSARANRMAGGRPSK